MWCFWLWIVCLYMASIAIFVFMVAPLRIFCCLVVGYCGVLLSGFMWLCIC